MINVQKLQAKYQQNCLEMQSLQIMIQNLETEYSVLTDQYMNGNIPWDIGKEQAKLRKQIDVKTNRVVKLHKENCKISQQLQRGY